MSACNNSSDRAVDDYLDDYQSQVSALRQASSNHSNEIMAANSIEDIEAMEARYRGDTREIFTDMEYIVSDMTDCMGTNSRGLNTNALRNDIESMRAMHEGHYDRMQSCYDLNTATDLERSYTQQMQVQGGRMWDNCQTMMSGYMGMICGGMHDCNGMHNEGMHNDSCMMNGGGWGYY